jgi:hypothetical protein
MNRDQKRKYKKWTNKKKLCISVWIISMTCRLPFECQKLVSLLSRAKCLRSTPSGVQPRAATNVIQHEPDSRRIEQTLWVIV